jgi:hypothetical protein
MLQAAVQARNGAATAGVELGKGSPATGAVVEADAIMAGAADAGGASEGFAEGLDCPASSHPPYGLASGAAALQMVRGMLGWLSGLCQHGDSIRAVAAAATSAPPLLRICLALRIACDRPKGLAGSIPGLAVAQPLSELDELCQSLLLFDPFRERLIADTLSLYDCHIGLRPAPTDEQVSAWLERPAGSGKPTVVSEIAEAGGAGGASATAATAAGTAATSVAIPHGASHPAPDPASSMSLLSLGKSSFLDTFSTRLFTGRAHTSAAVVDRAVPTLLHALRELLRLTLEPAGVGCLLPEPPSLRAQADVLLLDTFQFSGSMVVERVLTAGFGYVKPRVTMITYNDLREHGPRGRGGGTDASVIYSDRGLAESADNDEWCVPPHRPCVLLRTLRLRTQPIAHRTCGLDP